VAVSIGQADLNLLRQKHYRRSEHVPRPMFVQPVMHPARQISYLFKSYWPMRVRHVGVLGDEKSTFRRISEPHHTEYLIALNQFNLYDSILLIGVRRYGSTLRRIPA
jgi:hypothetical protein